MRTAGRHVEEDRPEGIYLKQQQRNRLDLGSEQRTAKNLEELRSKQQCFES